MDSILPGGVANAGQVIRQGDTVLRPSNQYSAAIHGFLGALRATGFGGAPTPLELLSDGRERLQFIDGDVPIPPYPDWAQSNEVLASISKLLLGFHRASSLVSAHLGVWSDELADPVGGTVVCHNDVCMENVVFRDGVAVGLLDFDFAAPGRPLYDLAQFARMCVPIDDELSAALLGWDVSDHPARLKLVTDAYGVTATAREQFLAIVDHTMNRGEEFVRRRVAAGDQNFIAMLKQVGGIERYERRRQWWDGRRTEFATALA